MRRTHSDHVGSGNKDFHCSAIDVRGVSRRSIPLNLGARYETGSGHQKHQPSAAVWNTHGRKSCDGWNGGGLAKSGGGHGVFQDLARKAPTSNYVSYNFGNAYSEIAAAHVALASQSRVGSDKQHEQWKQARFWYQKSLDVWLELQRQGKSGGDEVGEPERLPKEIAKCDKALARVQAINVPVARQ